MGCSKSKNSDGTDIGYTKPGNNDQEVKRSHSLSSCVTTANNVQDEKRSAMKKKGNGVGGAKKEKHVTFVEEKHVEMKEADSEDEPFYSAEEEDLGSKNPKTIQKDHV